METSPRREPFLDGLRGLAIGLVLVRHAFDLTVNVAQDSAFSLWLKTLFLYAYGGVELFFVLSGFLLGRIFQSEPPTSRMVGVFYLRRALRILPCYLLLLVSFLAMRDSAWLSRNYFTQTVPLWSYFALLQNHLIALSGSIGPLWLLITWSLAIEAQFYLVIPWLFRLLSRHALVTLCVAVVPLVLLTRGALVYQEDNLVAAIYSTACRAESLFLGVLLALLWHGPGSRAWLQRSRRWIAWGAALFTVLFFALPFSPAGEQRFLIAWTPTLLGLGFGMVLLLGLLWHDHKALHPLRAPWLQGLGRISYAVYLFHYPFVFVFDAWLCPVTEAARWLVTGVAYLATLAFAHLSWHGWEKRLIKLGHRLSYRENATP